MRSRLTRAASTLRTRIEATENLLQRAGKPVDVLTFAETAGLDLDPWQRDVLAGTWKRALLNVTRQGGKSTVAALLGLYEALYRPGSLTLIVSPSDRQSGELYRKLVALRDRLPMDFELLEDTKRSMTVRGGGRVASLPGSEATIRGFSAATLIVEDEASRVDDLLYEAVRPMLATTDGRLVLMSTPWGRRGHYYSEWTNGGDAKEAGLKPRGVLITSGDTSSRSGGLDRVPKRELVTVLQVAFQAKRLRISEELPLAEVLVRELLGFGVTISTTGHARFGNDFGETSWRTADHDDLVLATALAVWTLEKRKVANRSHLREALGFI